MKTLFTLFLILSSTYSFAGNKITCAGPRNSHILVITAKSITISRPFSNISRDIASEISVRTRIMGSGFSKFFYISGKKFTVHIDDRNNYSDVDDYMIIKSNSGHEITYPLDCK